MTRSIREIEQEIRSLQAAEKNQLLRDLISDIDGESEQDVEQQWLEEAKRRYQELREGLVKPVPAADVIAKAKARLKNES
jgi:hypothetical protein